MKNIKKYLFLLFLIIFPLNIYAFDFNINSEEVILINLNDNKVLYEQNSNEKTSVASLTKIMTAIVALNNIDNLEEKVLLTNEDFIGLKELDASISGFKVNNYYSYKELLYGLLLPSGADCANLLARKIGGSILSFVEMMNQEAKRLKMNNTNFVNPTGLDEKNHYSSAYDISLLLTDAIKNQDFLNILKTMNYETSDHIKLINTIEYYKKEYSLTMDYLIGGKTGYDILSGYNFASLATYNNINYLLVTTNASNQPEHFIDAKNIYEYYINNYNYQIVFSKGSLIYKLDTKYTKENNVKIYADKNYSYYLENNYDKNKITTNFIGVDYATSSIKKDTKLGILNIYYDSELLDSIDIFLPKKLHFSLIEYFKINTQAFSALIAIIFVLLLFICFIFNKNKTYRKKIIIEKHKKIKNIE